MIVDDCVCCKLCKRIFSKSAVLKHLVQITKCRNMYSDEEMQAFRDESRKRRNKNQSMIRKYDTDERSERHKKTYDPTKRAKKYQEDKERMAKETERLHMEK